MDFVNPKWEIATSGCFTCEMWLAFARLWEGLDHPTQTRATVKEIERVYKVNFGTKRKYLADYLRDEGFHSLSKALERIEKGRAKKSKK